MDPKQRTEGLAANGANIANRKTGRECGDSFLRKVSPLVWAMKARIEREGADDDSGNVGLSRM